MKSTHIWVLMEHVPGRAPDPVSASLSETHIRREARRKEADAILLMLDREWNILRVPLSNLDGEWVGLWDEDLAKLRQDALEMAVVDRNGLDITDEVLARAKKFETYIREGN